MRKLLRKIGYIKVLFILTVTTIIVAEILAYIVIKLFSYPYDDSTPYVTFMVASLTTPLLSWTLLKLLFELDEMEEKTYFLATYDSMTMLLRREAFFQYAMRIHLLAKQYDTPYSIAIVDIDNFKSINDKYGHDAGDKVIIHFGQILLDLFQLDKPIGRIGGEEFALVLPVESRDMEKKMKAVHMKLQETSIPYDDNLITYTVSIGIFGNVSPEKITLDEALSYADKALYEAKRTGKNKSVIYHEKIAFNDIPGRPVNLRDR